LREEAEQEAYKERGALRLLAKFPLALDVRDLHPNRAARRGQ